MALPDLNQYVLQMQNPSACLVDPILRQCSIKKNGLGNPQVRSGGFALTFCMEGNGCKWAVRCFHKESADRATRYRAISTQLKRPEFVKSGYFIEFDYQERGIQVGSTQYPIVKMSWASGETLGAFLEDNYSNRVALENLRQSMVRLRDFLSAHGVAHGDIQPGNVMVSDHGRQVQLIDYDGMFVPGLERLSASEIGLPNFQHPQRKTENPWGPHLDDFSFLIVDLGLRALQDDPSLWQRTGSCDDKLVFEVADYLAPTVSLVFNELKAKPQFISDVAKLQGICMGSCKSVPAASAVGNYTPSSRPSSAVPTKISYFGNYRVVSPLDYAALASSVGDVCEIVGLVRNVKSGLTKYGRPYLFVNFSQWRRGQPSFRIVLWSDMLAKMFGRANIDQRAYEDYFAGKYVSVSSLISVYESNTYQITPENPSAIRFIPAEEANFRLGKRNKTVCQPVQNSALGNSSTQASATKGSNAARVAQLLGKTGKTNSTTARQGNIPPRPLQTHAHVASSHIQQTTHSAIGGTTTQTTTRNSQLLNKLKSQGTQSTVSNATGNSSTQNSNGSSSGQRSNYSNVTPKNQRANSSGSVFVIWIIIGLIVLFFKCCK